MNTMLKMKIVVPASAGASAGDPASPRGGSTDPRQFLAMRARQKQAQKRARRWKLGILSAACVGMIAVALTSPRWRQRSLNAVEKQLQPVAVAVAAPAPESAPAAAEAPAPAPAETAPVAQPAPAVAAVAPAEAMSLSGCNDEFSKRQWRAAVATCTLAFEAAPDAALAMKVAHANWARGETANAGKWAARALEMGSDNADAYILVGHAARKAGNAEEAIDAFRKYVKAAPHGWHAGRAWAAIRELRAELHGSN
jgi:tetratricopeptide (TPR) repeat protein